MSIPITPSMKQIFPKYEPIARASEMMSPERKQTMADGVKLLDPASKIARSQENTDRQVGHHLDEIGRLTEMMMSLPQSATTKDREQLSSAIASLNESIQSAQDQHASLTKFANGMQKYSDSYNNFVSKLTGFSVDELKAGVDVTA